MNQNCKINNEDCSPPGGKITNNLCRTHYKRWLKHGDPNINKQGSVEHRAKLSKAGKRRWWRYHNDITACELCFIELEPEEVFETEYETMCVYCLWRLNHNFAGCHDNDCPHPMCRDRS